MDKKIEILEDALGRLDPELVEKTQKVPEKKPGHSIWQAILLAAALLLLIGVGFFLKDHIQVPGHKKTQEESEKRTKSALNPGQTGNYSVALAKYPELPEALDLKLIYEKMEAVMGSGDSAEYENQTELILEYGRKEQALQKALEKLRAGGVDSRYSSSLQTYTIKTSERILTDNNGKNIAYSPANLYLSLCMLSEVAGGDSRQELLDLLGLSDTAAAREVSNAVWRSLYREDPYGETLLANSLWLNESITFHDSTVNTLAEQYYTDVFSVPMGKDVANSALRDWINEKTGNLLREAAETAEIKSDAIAVLVSALYYKDTWTKKFTGAYNEKGVFTTASGQKTETEFMQQTVLGDCWAAEGKYCIAELPFESGASMVFLLPKEGVTLRELLESGEVTEGLLDRKKAELLSGVKINWRIPKFDVESNLSLTEMLESLGIKDIFDTGRADISPLTENGGYISQIKHAGRVRIDEEGCEAAAFTFAETVGGAGEAETVDMNLNRPFAFMITGVDGLPLFIGAVNEV